jgi:hypothetical protein
VSRDSEVRDAAAQLEGLLDALRENVAALNAILTPPPGPAREETAREPA